MMKLSGDVIKYDRDNINTDEIMNNEYLAKYDMDAEQLGKYCLIHYDPTFVERVKKGDILVAGYNFGCGSSKPAGLALMGAGVSVIVAKSFSRLFFRNALNLGVLPIESVKLAEETSDGDRLTIDLQEKRIRNETQKRDYAVPVYPYFIWEIIEHGGIIGWMQKSGGGFHEKYV